MRTLSIFAVAVAVVTNTSALAGWFEACRDEVFKEQAFSYEVFPDRDSVNQKPWLPYCEGYLEGLFETFSTLQIICVPKGTKVFQVTGSVHEWFEKKASLEEQRMPALAALNAWQDAFPCKKEDNKK